MTNEDKLREIFPKTIFIYHKEDDKTTAIQCSDEWLNAEYQEPTTKIDCDKTDCNNCINHKYCDYESTTKNDLGVDKEDAVERLNALRQLIGYDKDSEIVKATQKSLDMAIKALDQEPKTGHCKDCKWWKDKDGVYRRGISAESKCPINRREVMEGMGYCFMFEQQERSDT